MTSDGVSHGRSDLRSLTGLRFVAAFVVFAFHTAGYGTIASHWWRVTSLGFVGVGFFFVLSGVVLTWSMRPAQRAPDFWRRRVARIYPSYVVATLAATAVYEWLVPPHKPLWAVPLVLALMHAWWPAQRVQSAADGVSWSLSCEALFYLVFPWLVVALGRRTRGRRHLLVGLLLVACSIVAVGAGFVDHGRYDVVAYEEPLVRLGEFGLGLAIGLALREGWVPRLRRSVAWWTAGGAWAALLGYGAIRGWPVPRGLADVVTLVPMTLLIVAYAGADLTGRRSRLGSRVAVYLGQISFAFYLVHQVAMDVLVRKVAPVAHVSLPRSFGWSVTGLAAALLLAMALHHGVELPGQRAILRRRRQGSATPVAAARGAQSKTTVR